MKATIWHNPNCGTSRNTLAILRETPGIDIEVVEYLKTPPSREQLVALYARAGITPHQGLRVREALAAELQLLNADDDAVLDAMMEHPILIERPIVETTNGVRLARPPERVREIL